MHTMERTGRRLLQRTDTPADPAPATDPDDRPLFLSTTPADRSEQWLTALFVLVSLMGAVIVAPFARLPLPELPVFVAIYQTTLAAFDTVTLVFLFGQFLILRSRALLVLACGYLFTAIMAVAHLLTFPHVFTAAGLLGAGPQSALWLFWFWHAGFLIAVIAYALLKREDGPMPGSVVRILAGAIAVTLCAAGALGLAATLGEPILPAIMRNGQRIAQLNAVPLVMVFGLGSVTLALLLRGRPQTGLDLWLTAVVWAWLLDVALSALLANGRYQLGFYAGRSFGLVAAALMLAALVMNINRLYARQVAAGARLAADLADMRRLHEVSTQLAGKAGLPQVLADILDAVIALQHADFGRLLLRDPATQAMTIAAQRGLPPALLDQFAIVAADDGSPSAQAMHRSERIVAEDVMTDEAWVRHRPFAARMGFRGVQSTPIFGRDDRLKGLLTTYFRTPAHLSERDLRLTDLYVRLAADLIEGAESADALRAAARVAEEANRTKDRFMATASHDLRQPLQSLSLLNGALRRLVADPRGARAVAGQEQAIATMSALLNSLLDISKLEAGAIRPQVADVWLDGLFDQLGIEFAGLAAAKGLRLDMKGAGHAVRSDPALLGQILRNLIGNAIRYTREGWVRVTCVPEGALLRIDVADTGIGMDPAHVAHIFEEFYQIGVPPNATREGHGLGLSVVQRTARLLQHEIRVHSRPGEGSTFSVLLPAGVPAATA